MIVQASDGLGLAEKKMNRVIVDGLGETESWSSDSIGDNMLALPSDSNHRVSGIQYMKGITYFKRV